MITIYLIFSSITISLIIIYILLKLNLNLFTVNNRKVLFILFFIYTILTIVLYVKNLSIYKNIVNPLFWILILIYLIIYKKDYFFHLSNKKKQIMFTIVISVIFVVFDFTIGLITGFTKSPYNHHLDSIIKNFFTIIIPLIGLEYSRCFLIIKYKHNKVSIIFITLLFILMEINYRTLINTFFNKELFFQYICSTILPIIANNILYTYLVFNSNYPLPLIYKIINKLMLIFAFFLPSMDWYMVGSLSLIKVTLFYVIYKYKFTKEKKYRNKNSFVLLTYAFTLGFATIFISFMLGLFKYEPIAILSNSMSPTFRRGDVVIFKKENSNKLTNGNIIIYSLENKFIAHRIIKTIDNNNSISFITKGDANNTPDYKNVQPNQIKGVYVFHIKYIGYPSIWLKQYFSNSKMY